MGILVNVRGIVLNINPLINTTNNNAENNTPGLNKGKSVSPQQKKNLLQKITKNIDGALQEESSTGGTELKGLSPEMLGKIMGYLNDPKVLQHVDKSSNMELGLFVRSYIEAAKKTGDVNKDELCTICKLATSTQIDELVKTDLISLLIDMAKQTGNSPNKQLDIASAIQNIATNDAGRKALIDNSAVPLLVTIANQADSTPEVRSKIASAIQNIATSDVGREALINNSAVSLLLQMSNQTDITSEEKTAIAGAMADIAKIDAGKTALFKKSAIFF